MLGSRNATTAPRVLQLACACAVLQHLPRQGALRASVASLLSQLHTSGDAQRVSKLAFALAADSVQRSSSRAENARSAPLLSGRGSDAPSGVSSGVSVSVSVSSARCVVLRVLPLSAAVICSAHCAARACC